MKFCLKSTLKDINNNRTEQISVTAKKEKNKIIYQTDEYKHIIKIVSPNSLILNRSNDIVECTMNFELNKICSAIYTIKKEEYTIEIDIKTTNIEITDEKININYTVVDSNNSYEYIIEMSEYK